MMLDQSGLAKKQNKITTPMTLLEFEEGQKGTNDEYQIRSQPDADMIPKRVGGLPSIKQGPGSPLKKSMTNYNSITTKSKDLAKLQTKSYNLDQMKEDDGEQVVIGEEGDYPLLNIQIGNPRQ